MASQAKYGRGKRSPSSKYYTSVKKWELNKQKRIKKEAKKQDSPKKMKVPRGSMRTYKRNKMSTTVTPSIAT